MTKLKLNISITMPCLLLICNLLIDRYFLSFKQYGNFFYDLRSGYFLLTNIDKQGIYYPAQRDEISYDCGGNFTMI